MALISRALGRRRISVAVTAALLAALVVGAAAPAATASPLRLCPDRTKSVFDGLPPTDAGAYVLDEGVYRPSGHTSGRGDVPLVAAALDQPS